MDYIKKARKNYNIYFVHTDNFKTINVSFIFQRPITRLDKLYQTLLRKMLYLKTAKYGSLEELTRAAANIYNPVTVFSTKTSSQHRTFTLQAEFANEKYTEKGMNKKNLEFIMDYFWHPAVTNNSFDEKLFAICQKNYIEELKSLKNYPDTYSLDECWRLLDLYDFEMPSSEELIEELKKITPQMLYDYYKSMFTEDSLDIFVFGNTSDDITDIIDNYIYGDFVPSIITSPKRFAEVRAVKEKREKSDNPQSKLHVCYKVLNPTSYEEKYISLIFSMVLGGGTESYLHQEAREKQSLCYYIYATSYNLFNVILISSGIDKRHTDKVLTIIKEEVKKIQNGILDEKRVKEVIKTYENVLLESRDSQESLVNSLVSEVMRNADDMETKFQVIKNITCQDIIDFAKKIKLDTIYLLEGR